MKRVIVMGPPGVGKGTQAASLAAMLGVIALSTGDLFREQVRTQTPLGLEVEELLAGGSYVPDRITNRIVAKRLADVDARAGFILDGYPRTMPQVSEFDGWLKAHAVTLDAVVLMYAPTAEITARLLLRAQRQGRPDDTADIISRRIEAYKLQTAPLADEYEARGLLLRVDGSGEPSEVESRIGRVLSTVARRER